MRKFNFKATIGLICLVLQFTSVYSQTSTLSPYSRFGIGDLLFTGFANQRAMGGTGIGSVSATRVNFMNPASYAYDTLSTLEIGVQGEYIKQQQNSISATQSNAGLNTLTLAFPILRNKIGMSFGLNPYSGTGYNIQSTEIIDTNNTKLSSKYEGSGGYTRYYLGIGGKITKNLSVGVNASYLYGTVNRKRRADFSNSIYFNNQYITEITLTDLYLELGLHWNQMINDNLKLGIGITGAPSQNINGRRSTLWVNYKYDSNQGDFFKDTIDFESRTKGEVTLPLNLGVGINLSNTEKWLVNLDANYQDWSSYKSFDNLDTLQNSFRIAIGGQFSPDPKDTKYLNRIQYRAGLSYSQTSLELRNNQLDDKSFSFGFGLPLRKSLQSMINFGFEFGQRGTTKDNLVKEQYSRVVIGLTFNELWFQKRRYD